MDIKNELSTTSSSSLSPVHKQALEKYLPQNFLPVIKNVTSPRHVLAAAASQKSGSLAKMSKAVGAERAEGLIKIYLVRMNELLDLNKPLSEAGIDEVAETLVRDFYALTMVDVAFVLQQAIRGKYGVLYESLNPPKVLKWFSDYFDERCNTAETMSDEHRQNQHNSLYGRERSSDQGNEQREFSKQYAIQQITERYTNAVPETPNTSDET